MRPMSVCLRRVEAALFNAIQVLIDHGDEVVVPVPYWVSYKDIIQYAGGTPVFVETQEAENFRVTAAMIEAALTPKTKAIILNTPSNPAGAVMSTEDLEAIVRLGHARGIFVMLDECYIYLDFAGKPVSGASFAECREHVIVLGSLSKTYAMTGWRAGYALGPKPIIAAISKLQSQSTSNAASMVPAGGDCGSFGPAGVCGGDARGVCGASGSGAGGVSDDPGAAVHGAAGRVLCVPEREQLFRQGRGAHGGGCGSEAAE